MRKIGKETVEVIDELLAKAKAGKISGEELAKHLPLIELRLKADANERAKERNAIEAQKVKVSAYNAVTKAASEDRLRNKELNQKELTRTAEIILLENNKE
jgi:hypothetical protein